MQEALFEAVKILLSSVLQRGEGDPSDGGPNLIILRNWFIARLFVKNMRR
jgi:hypothetical protein